MLLRVDIKAKLEDLGVRRNPIVSEMRPAIRIKEGYLTTGIMEFEEITQDSGLQGVNIMFVTPRYYPNSVWMGKTGKVTLFILSIIFPRDRGRIFDYFRFDNR